MADSGKSYTNTRTGATRRSASLLGYPYVETALIDKGGKAAKAAKAAKADEPAEPTGESVEPAS